MRFLVAPSPAELLAEAVARAVSFEWTKWLRSPVTEAHPDRLGLAIRYLRSRRRALKRGSDSRDDRRREQSPSWLRRESAASLGNAPARSESPIRGTRGRAP